MRIISKKHDYYDSIQKHGVSDKIFYIRKEQLFYEGSPEYRKVSEAMGLKDLKLYFFFNNPISNFWIISFCEKIFHVVKLYFDGKSKFCFSLEEIDEAVEKYGDKDQKASWNKDYKKIRFRNYRRTAQKIFDHNNFNMAEIHHETKVPIIMYDWYNRRIHFNPILSKLKFYRLMDSYTTYQELAQYVGGVLSNNSSPAEKISDVIKRDMHGFDEWSFKKMKESS